MANRSDFLGQLPREIKRIISLGVASGLIDRMDAGETRKIFAAAHKIHKSFKMKKSSLPTKAGDAEPNSEI